MNNGQRKIRKCFFKLLRTTPPSMGLADAEQRFTWRRRSIPEARPWPSALAASPGSALPRPRGGVPLGAAPSLRAVRLRRDAHGGI